MFTCTAEKRNVWNKKKISSSHIETENFKQKSLAVGFQFVTKDQNFSELITTVNKKNRHSRNMLFDINKL